MQNATSRDRTGSVSDVHIQQCDCSYCDGVGEVADPLSFMSAECPVCEGIGYLEPATQAAYEAYLNDLYREVVRTMPSVAQKDAASKPSKVLVRAVA